MKFVDSGIYYVVNLVIHKRSWCNQRSSFCIIPIRVLSLKSNPNVGMIVVMELPVEEVNSMSKTARLFCCGLLVCLVTVSGFAQRARPFSWSLGLQNVKSGSLVPFSAPIQSYTGEQFRLVITPGTECFAYVIYESPGGEDVAVLYSGAMKGGESWQSDVLELALPKGSESIFVVVSRLEQKNLAARISVLNNSTSPTQRRALMNEIFRLRSDVSKFKEAPEKPVLMGGAARGSPEKSQGVEFSGLETYVKTISFEH